MLNCVVNETECCNHHLGVELLNSINDTNSFLGIVAIKRGQLGGMLLSKTVYVLTQLSTRPRLPYCLFSNRIENKNVIKTICLVAFIFAVCI